MTENNQEEIIKATAEEHQESSCSRHSACKPHTSLYISIIALLLALYAAIAAGTSTAPANGEARLASLESSVQLLGDQVVALSKDVESNRENLVQNQLKKALLNIQEISGMAREETKATIAEIEKILHDLTSPAEATADNTETSLPATASEAAAVVEPEAEAPPAAEVAPEPAVEETTDAAVVETPAEELPAAAIETPAVEAPAPDMPATEAPEEAPAVEAPATETPIEAPAAPEQSAPQAF
ncbi:hypothetical protein [Mariprofundus sp. KV]|uniref:hypothetical protein n=1 Tax=Mariprofundus sp. KV TaxID=2608715 RepID=UPI0015A2729A|nr:hypothetical protein [Mariprofundus sp. KV]